ncbi:MAG: hypothetical protein B6D41_20235 [Chloroflexi bacterium UTCFX4]|jgi:hypothetical protein|nr:MAG: hypothetical protein B6D41_20235 [Chloroflexi bacterium UTCFX4]
MSEWTESRKHDGWKSVISDPPRLLQTVTRFLQENEIAFCVIGGQAVSAYVEPVVSLDLDIVIAPEQMAQAEKLLTQHFQVRRFKPFFSISLGNSDFRVQIHSNAQFAGFIERATPRPTLDLELPVASLRDVFLSKVWAAQDPARRASKRQKDLADLARILEVYPHLGELLPDDLRARMF